MSNIIDFLERVGKDAHLRHAPDAALERALAEAHIDPSVREAILLRDQPRLEALLGANANVCCMVYSPMHEDDEPEEEERKEQDDDGEEEPAARLSAG